MGELVVLDDVEIKRLRPIQQPRWIDRGEITPNSIEHPSNTATHKHFGDVQVEWSMMGLAVWTARSLRRQAKRLWPHWRRGPGDGRPSGIEADLGPDRFDRDVPPPRLPPADIHAADGMQVGKTTLNPGKHDIEEADRNVSYAAGSCGRSWAAIRIRR